MMKRGHDRDSPECDGIILVIPFRKRQPQLDVLLRELRRNRRNVWKIIVCEQARGLPFNRGWVKNVGFLLSLQQVCANDRNPTIYFHDVDLLPKDRMETYVGAPLNTIMHLYGHTHCLGGVVGMLACVFKRIGGFPTSLWAWGYEDTALQTASEKCNDPPVSIERSTHFVDRFTDDDVWQELDSNGIPMFGKDAMKQFCKTLDAKESCQTHTSLKSGGLDTTAFEVIGRRSDGDEFVTHYVVKHTRATDNAKSHATQTNIAVHGGNTDGQNETGNVHGKRDNKVDRARSAGNVTCNHDDNNSNNVDKADLGHASQLFDGVAETEIEIDSPTNNDNDNDEDNNDDNNGDVNNDNDDNNCNDDNNDDNTSKKHRSHLHPISRQTKRLKPEN